MPENPPKISIIVPTRNEEENLRDFFETLGNGSEFEDYEVVVVDGNSEDDTREVAEKHGARIIEGPGKGLTYARNIGWKKAEGEYVMMTDADYTFEEGFLDDVAEAMKEGDADVYTTSRSPVSHNFVSELHRLENEVPLGKMILPRMMWKLMELVKR